MANNFWIRISLRREKRGGRVSLLRDYRPNVSVTHQELERLTGRLSLSQTLLFGKFDRAKMRPLYQKLQRRVYNAELKAMGVQTFGRRVRVVRSFNPRARTPV